MNKDQLQGIAKNISGIIKKQAEGKVQHHIGDLKQFVKHMKNI
jgi:uncharacterized protein YjbJ (UPF0337 family)